MAKETQPVSLHFSFGTHDDSSVGLLDAAEQKAKSAFEGNKDGLNIYFIEDSGGIEPVAAITRRLFNEGTSYWEAMALSTFIYARKRVPYPTEKRMVISMWEEETDKYGVAEAFMVDRLHTELRQNQIGFEVDQESYGWDDVFRRQNKLDSTLNKRNQALTLASQGDAEEALKLYFSFLRETALDLSYRNRACAEQYKQYIKRADNLGVPLVVFSKFGYVHDQMTGYIPLKRRPVPEIVVAYDLPEFKDKLLRDQVIQELERNPMYKPSNLALLQILYTYPLAKDLRDEGYTPFQADLEASRVTANMSEEAIRSAFISR